MQEAWHIGAKSEVFSLYRFKKNSKLYQKKLFFIEVEIVCYYREKKVV